MLFSGCSHGGKTPASPSEEPTAAPTEEPAPQEGGVLRLAMPVNAPIDDPLDVTTEEMLGLFSLVFESLLTVNAAGEIEPCLCESWTGGDGVWLLHLRSGVKWHDGSGTLRSQDVITTYRELVTMEDSYYKPCLEHIVRMVAVDELSISVQFDIKGIMGLYALTFPIRRSGKLNGTGAYRLESMTDHEVHLKVNEDWWNQRPYIERVIYSERDSNSTALASYEAAQLNMVPTDILTAGKYSDPGTTNVHDVMTQELEALLFNYASPVLSDLNIRLAIAHGINRSRIITNVYSNKARASDVPIAPDNWLYDSRCAVLNYDPDASAQLIEDAGYTVVSQIEDGLRYSRAGNSLYLRLLTSATKENTVRSDAAQMIANHLSTLGFKVELITKAHSLGDPESEFIKALEEGDWDVALVGFNIGLCPDFSRYFAPGGSNNFGHINDPLLSQKASALYACATEEELREAAYALQSYFVETAP
ncbi:MAG: hypothetical protein J6P98_09345, partial [Clostridia bacterium]|nr:hypothetical protein [Clostridia bacterium]